MQNIYTGSAFNANNTFVPGVYLQVIPPQNYFSGVPTTVAAVDGTASWGKKNVPQLTSNPTQQAAFYGGITSQSLNDPHDLNTDMALALSQAQGQSALQVYGNRVTDGTDTAATTLVYTGTSQTVTLTGTPTVGDVINIHFVNAGLTTGFYDYQHTVTSPESTLATLASDIETALAGNATLTAAGFTFAVATDVITASWSSGIGAVTIKTSTNGTTSLTVGGSATTNDVLSVTVFDSGLPGGSQLIQYVVPGSSTSTTIATGIAAAVNGNLNLASIGVTATTNAGVVSLVSASTHQTTFTEAVSTGATETLTLGAGPGETAPVGTASLCATVAGIYTGSLANSGPSNQNGIIMQITTGFVSGTVNVTVVPFAGGGPPELFTGLPGSGNLFGNALLQALNFGSGRPLGPSQWLRVSSSQATSSGPAPGIYYFSGGTDGRNVTSGNLIGSATSSPPSGIYAFQNLQFNPSVMWVAGLTDSATWATIQTFCNQNNIFGLLTFAAGVSTASAVSLKATAGIATYSIGFVKDWVYFYDSINSITRLVSPLSVAGGFIATLPPQASPCNQQVYSISGTERNNLVTGTVPYGYAELNQLGQAGIMLLTNPIEMGAVFGFENGWNSVGNNAVTAPVEYSRMTNYLIATNGNLLGQFIGQLQSIQAGDPFKANVRTALNTAFQTLQTNFVIDAFNVLCNSTNNTQATIAQHICNIAEQFTYLSSVLFINVQMQGGTTVVVATNQLGQTLTTQTL